MYKCQTIIPLSGIILTIMEDKLFFKKLDEKAILPTRGSSHAAALDLYSIESVTILPGKFTGVKTGLAVQIPEGYYGRIAPRSGLAIKHGIDTLAGVVDCDYRGELICLLMNFGDKDFVIEPGDRIAQFLIEKIITPKPEFVEALPESGRSTGGFGSTGK
jgi:dUTP pyrophosphatase